MSSPPLLEVRDLCVALGGGDASQLVVDHVSFSLTAGEILALVGESGVGKTMLALALLRLVPDPPARVVGGQVVFAGQDLLALKERALCAVRGRQIAMVFQEPLTALNPVLTVGEQVAEALRLHQKADRAQARQCTLELFHRVGLAAPAERYAAYPHQLSGGMRQRVVLAMALACGPRLLLADEPTTALDVTTQQQVMEILKQERAQHALSILLITHDLALVAHHADRVMVLYAGQVVEVAPTRMLFAAPLHPYTATLLRSALSLAGQGISSVEHVGNLADSRPPAERAASPPAPGSGGADSASAPEQSDAPPPSSGCRFAHRCSRVQTTCCGSMPPLSEAREGRYVRCLFPLLEKDASP